MKVVVKLIIELQTCTAYLREDCIYLYVKKLLIRSKILQIFVHINIKTLTFFEHFDMFIWYKSSSIREKTHYFHQYTTNNQRNITINRTRQKNHENNACHANSKDNNLASCGSSFASPLYTISNSCIH